MTILSNDTMDIIEEHYRKGCKTYDADILIDKHINKKFNPERNFQLLSIEDKSGKCIYQVLIDYRIDTEDVWERFSEFFPEACGFATTDKKHRDNARLYFAHYPVSKLFPHLS